METQRKKVECKLFLRLLIPVAIYANSGCGSKNSSQIKNLWALNQFDEIVVAKGIHQGAITIFRCPSAKNVDLLGDAVDLTALDSCADKVMVNESLSYQDLKDTLLGISPYLIHEMTDATQVDLFAQYFDEREGFYERIWLQKRRDELKQRADTANALIIRKKTLGKKVAPGDEVKLDKTRTELLEAEKALEALDSIEKQIELLTHEFWDLIQQKSVFQTRLTSLRENIVFLGLDEAKTPKHNLFNLWFRDISTLGDRITISRVLDSKNRLHEDGSRINIDESLFVTSSGESMLLFDWKYFHEKSGQYSKRNPQLTTATFDEFSGSLIYETQEIGSLCHKVLDYKVFSNLILLQCEPETYKNEFYLAIEVSSIYPLKFDVTRIDKISDGLKTNVKIAKVAGEWIFLISESKTRSCIITSLSKLKTKSEPIWKGIIPSVSKPASYLLGFQKVKYPNEGVVFSYSTNQSYFVPWPIQPEIKGDGLIKIFSASVEVKIDAEKYDLGDFLSPSGRTHWFRTPKEKASVENRVVQFIAGVDENLEAPGEFAAITSEYTIPIDDLLVRAVDTMYWRGHLIPRRFENHTPKKITRPYFY